VLLQTSFIVDGYRNRKTKWKVRMARRRQFVSTGLHNISKHIAESTSGKQKTKQAESEDDVSPESLGEDVAEEVCEEPAEKPADSKTTKTAAKRDVIDDEGSEADLSDSTPVVQEPVVAQETLMEHKKGDNLSVRRGKERQKAVERRANEFVNARRDMMTRLTQSLATIPDDIESCELRIKLLRQYKEIYEDLVVKIEPLDDSSWSKGNYDSELGRSMKVIENARLEYLSSSARLEKVLSGDEAVVAPHSSTFDVASLTFGQLFRLGFIFSLPVIGALIFSALIISMSYFVIVS